MNARPLKLRLTAWYAFILAATFVVAGAGIWLALRASIYKTADKELRSRMVVVRQFLEIDRNNLPELAEEMKEQTSPDGAQIRIVVAGGKKLFASAGTESWDKLPEGITETVSADSRRFRVLSTAAEGGVAQIGIPMDVFEDLLSEFTWAIVLTAPLLLLLASAGGYWMSGRALARLEAAFERVTQFTANASHELRTPLAIMRTTAEVTRAKPRAPEEHIKAWDSILKESERTSRLIDDLLLLARADAGSDGLVFEPVDLAACLRDAEDEMHLMADAAGLRLETSQPAECTVSGDGDALRRLIFILVDNAIKYTPRGGEIAVRMEVAQGKAAIAVRDTGAGISQEDQAHIFDRFYRAAKDRSRKTGGAGLGLAIAQWLATRHGGEIVVHSTPGSGSEFRVILPVKS